MLENTTPLMKQYGDLKNQVPDAILLFRMGDFYELFGDDAVFASEVLDITLTSRDKNRPNPVPMAGFPHHQVQSYIQKLLKAGKKVAIGEQLEAEKNAPSTTETTGPKMVRREIVRILTPGVHFDPESSEAQYLGILLPTADSKNFALACLESSTGELLLLPPCSWDTVQAELRKLPIRHFLHWEGVPPIELSSPVLMEDIPKNRLSLSQAEALLRFHYEVKNLKPFFSCPETLLASGVLVSYVLKTQQKERLAHLRLPQPLKRPESLSLGPNTPDHLDLKELFQLLHRDLSQTRSALGARQLKRSLFQALTHPQEIQARQQAVQALVSKRSQLSTALAQIYDLERICSRITTGLAGPKDTLCLGQSLAAIPAINLLLLDLLPSGPPESTPQKTTLSSLYQTLESAWKNLEPLSERILRTQKEDPPLLAREGGIFQPGTSPPLDHLLSLTEGGQKWLLELEAREREATEIPSLKVRYNRVFGYYIEITQAHLKIKTIPAHYQRKQTMVGAERFFTEELKKFEEEILTASLQQKNLELELFELLLADIQKEIPSIMKVAQALGELDMLACFSHLTQIPGWIFPTIDESFDLDIVQGQHPILFHRLRGKFVPNDVQLSRNGATTWIVTGPNMGGKSTFMRQIALLILLGQMGAPLPAKQARWGVFSSLHTRIGAQDAILQGQSTFMVEMSELASILHEANERSLILLDEVGRGTSTYDGMSVAWASLSWIVRHIQARTFFATHYHELIHLSQELPGLAHAHVAVEGGTQKEKRGSQNALRFLYQVKPGPTHESFGIQVAQLAGLPQTVIAEAWKTLKILEEKEAVRKNPCHEQLSLFEAQPTRSPSPHPPLTLEPSPEELALREIKKELEALDLLQTTPLQALQWLTQLKERVI